MTSKEFERSRCLGEGRRGGNKLKCIFKLVFTEVSRAVIGPQMTGCYLIGCLLAANQWSEAATARMRVVMYCGAPAPIPVTMMLTMICVSRSWCPHLPASSSVSSSSPSSWTLWTLATIKLGSYIQTISQASIVTILKPKSDLQD